MWAISPPPSSTSSSAELQSAPPVAPQSEAGVPESQSEEVRDEQGRDEDLEEICGEDPTLLHDSASPHTQRH